MKSFLSAFGALALLGSAALAQVTVEVEFDQDQYLPHEALFALVRITNFSGRTLTLGQEPEWLTFGVESVQGHLVLRHSAPAVIEEFQVPSSARATRRVDLAPHFDLSQPGRYEVVATVRVRELGAEISSRPAAVNVIKGTELWSQVVGVPATGESAAQPPELRRYALLQAFNKKVIRLYVQVTEPETERTYGVYPIGPMLSFSRPEAQIDRRANLHVLFQTGARPFTYCVVAPDARLAVRQTHHYTDTRPALRGDAQGNIVVYGGVRVRDLTDLPAPAPAARPPEPTATAAPGVVAPHPTQPPSTP
ncbi:MAG: hypothetical protein FJ387_03970 [Verrucomicrobia bacterium]|nr:hypothetical protein [Verrucomicrobiota bacterium]